MFKILMTALFATTATMASAATTPAFTDLVVFGDSLSDSGNIAPGFTFTNGQTFAGQLGALPFASGGTNFAFGGAQAATNDDASPDFAAQRELFNAFNPTLGDNPLTVVFFGGNDLLNATDGSAVVNALTAISTGIGDLANRFGLTRFLVPGLPDLGRIPLNLNTPGAGAATAASVIFNDLLQQQVTALDASPFLDVTFLDTFSLLNTILDDPAAAGFDPDTAGLTCLSGTIDCDGFVFFDGIHPTQAVHAILAGEVLAAAAPAPVPLPAGGLLLLTAIGGLVAARRRGRATA